MLLVHMRGSTALPSVGKALQCYISVFFITAYVHGSKRHVQLCAERHYQQQTGMYNRSIDEAIGHINVEKSRLFDGDLSRK